MQKIPENKTPVSLAPSLNEEQESLLKKLYYDDKLFVGRDRLYHYVAANHPNVGISRRQVMAWLKLQKPWQLTKAPVRRAHTSLMDIRKEGYMSCDLKGPLHKDKGYTYVFAIVDVASRKQYAKPIRDATATAARDALKAIIEENDLNITLLRSDNGTHFKGEFTEFLIESGIKQLYSTPHSPWQNRQERQFRTMFDMVYKHQIATNSSTWVDVLPKIIDGMNATVNRSMKVTPNEASENGLPAHVNEERSRNYGVMKKHLSTKSTFKVGDLVRTIRRDRGTFSKDRRRWSEDVFVIAKVVHQTDSRLVTYKVSSDGVNLEKPSYNITELLLVNDTNEIDYPELTPEDAAVGERTIHDQREVDQLLIETPEVAIIRETRRPEPVEGEDVYVAEKVLGKRKRKGKAVEYRVKWMGYPLSDSTWEFAKNLSGARDLVKEFLDKQKKK